jgi:hypothetical protein
VIDTTSKVTGKVLNPDDQRRLQDEAPARSPPESPPAMKNKKEVASSRENCSAPASPMASWIRAHRALVNSLIQKKPRNYVAVLDAYKRLLRLEIEKRSAVIESATELAPDAAAEAPR